MGFPTLVHSTYPAICGCHGKLRVSGYSCPRCRSRICDVPTECRVCGLTVVNAPQLARSYRHLFPVNLSSLVLSRLSHGWRLWIGAGRELREITSVPLPSPLSLPLLSLTPSFHLVLDQLHRTLPPVSPVSTLSPPSTLRLPHSTTRN